MEPAIVQDCVVRFSGAGSVPIGEIGVREKETPEVELATTITVRVSF